MIHHIIAFMWGVVVGFSTSVPIGPVGFICIQRTISKRILAGLITGLGAVVGDAFMASVGIFGIKSISDFIIDNQTILRVLGGLILIFMGTSMVISKQKVISKKPDTAITYIEYFFSSLAIVITNPITAGAFFLIFAGISPRLVNNGNYFGINILFGVIVGACLWWLLLTFIANVFGHLIKEEHFSTINRFLGVIVLLLGIVIMGGLVLKFI